MLRMALSRRLVVLASLTAMLFISPSAHGAAVVQPEPPRPGEPAPSIQAAYEAAQSRTTDPDEIRIKVAIQSYFDLKAQSLVLGKALDLGIVIDRSVEAGENFYRYELGLLEYSLTLWEYDRVAFSACEYEPTYDSVQIDSDTARVSLRLRRLYAYTDTSHVDVLEGEEHIIDLTRTAKGWKLKEDAYGNEMTDVNPRGTDFAAKEHTARR